MLKAIVFIALWLPVTLLGQTDSLEKVNQEYFRPKAGDYYLNGYTSWSKITDISVFDVDLRYRKMISDRRFYGGSIGFEIIKSDGPNYSFMMFGPTYGIYFTKNSDFLGLTNYPCIMGYLPIIISSDDNTEFGIVSYIGSTFPIKGRFGLTPWIMVGYAMDLIVGFRVGIEIDPNPACDW